MAGAIPSVTHSKPIRFGAWSIYRNDFTAHPNWRLVAWLYAHDDYDGPEDGRAGVEASVEDCISAIQEREAA